MLIHVKAFLFFFRKKFEKKPQFVNFWNFNFTNSDQDGNYNDFEMPMQFCNLQIKEKKKRKKHVSFDVMKETKLISSIKIRLIRAC